MEKNSTWLNFSSSAWEMEEHIIHIFEQSTQLFKRWVLSTRRAMKEWLRSWDLMKEKLKDWLLCGELLIMTCSLSISRTGLECVMLTTSLKLTIDKKSFFGNRLLMIFWVWIMKLLFMLFFVEVNNVVQIMVIEIVKILFNFHACLPWMQQYICPIHGDFWDSYNFFFEAILFAK